MERRAERAEAVGVIGRNRQRWRSRFAIVGVISAWFGSTGVLVLWWCMVFDLNIAFATYSPIRDCLALASSFVYIGAITAFPLEIAVIFVYLPGRLWAKILLGISVLLGTALAAYWALIMLAVAAFAGW